MSVGILGTGSYLPEKVLRNADLEKMVETSDEWIVSRTGIRERRIADSSQASSDLAYEASKKAIESAGIAASDLDLIIVATVTPDMVFPPTATLLQHKLGIANVAAFDVSAACTGFLYSLVTAVQYIKSGLYKHVLVVGVECLSRITNWEDRSTCILFGDGAGAVVVGPTDDNKGFLSFDLGADGSAWDILKLPGGGSRLPTSYETIRDGKHFIDMNGREVFKFAVRVIVKSIEAALLKANLEKSNLDVFVPHQANLRIIDAAAKRFGLSSDKCVVNLDRYGNISSASIPIALDEAVRGNMIKSGNIVALCGFGGGMTWGTTIIKW